MAGKVGRPNLYIERVQPRLDEIGEWAKAKATNKAIAAGLGVGYSNFTSYVKKYPELAQVLRDARKNNISEIYDALFQSAKGGVYTERKKITRTFEDGTTQVITEVIKREVPPNTNAIGMYLRNYDPEYRDRDAKTYEIKDQELELKRTIAEQNSF